AKKISELRLWHALPTKRQWSGIGDGTPQGTAAQSISFAPDTGKQEQQLAQNSNHMVWRLKQGLKPGDELTFSSHYTVHSTTRTFDPKRVKSSWPENFNPPEDIEPALAKMADQVKAAMSPTEAVQQFCTSIKASLTYDASVTYKPLEVDQTVKNHRGHCGHIYQVFAQLCRRVGLPVRPVRGLNLRNSDGSSNIGHLRADWNNIHTWAEVYFEGIGWVEIEPFGGTRAFSIDSRFVQNNQWFQNYVLKVNVDGEWKNASWTPEEGVFVSPFNLSNVVTFTATRE
ncbi:transglutaminase domain-containing protein, partial [bacterium]